MAGNGQQTWIARKFVPSLSVSSVEGVMPSNLRRVYLKDLVVGSQPPDTYILGEVQDIFTLASRTDRVSRKLVLREIYENDCSGLQVEVFTYGQYARQLEGSHSSHLWAAISGANFRKYMGFNKQNWCPLSIRIGAGSNANSSLTLIGLSSVRPSSAIEESFSSLESEFNIPRPHTAAGAHPTSTGLGKPNTDVTPSSSTGLGRPSSSIETCPSSMGPPTSTVSMSNRPKGNARRSIEFVTLSKLKENVRQNTYVLVNDVVKEPTLTKRNVYHMIVILVDPSCAETENVRRKDLLFHIFSNDISEPLPYSISRGDILRIRDMRVEMYYLENRYHGKIYSSKQLVAFTSGLQDPIVPRTTKEDFVVSDQDIEYIQNLRKWWASASNHLDKERKGQHVVRPAEQCSSPYVTISNIGEEMDFCLYCQVLEVRYYSDTASVICILRVRDGTHTNYLTPMWDLDTATPTLNTQTDMVSLEGATSICITIIKDAETAAELKEGMFVELQQVRVETVSNQEKDRQSKRVLEFVMDRPTSRIIVLASHHAEARKISSCLKDQNDESELDSCGTVHIRAQDMNATPPRHIPSRGKFGGVPCRPATPNATTHSPHLPSQSDSWEHALGNLSYLNVESSPSQRQVDEQLENVPRAAEEAPQELSNQQHSYNSHPNNHNLITENSEINFPADIPTSTQKDSSARWDKDEAEGQRTKSRQMEPVNDTNLDQPYPVTQDDCMLTSLTPSSTSSGIVVKERAGRKREGSNDNSLQKRIKEVDTSALNSAPTKPSLENPNYERVSVKELLKNAEDKKLYRVKGKLVQILVKTNNSCTENNKCCVHDIMQGICQACMKYYYRSDLLNKYPLPELKRSSSPNDYLPCLHCTTHSVTESEKPRTVVPLFGLHLVLEEEEEEDSKISVMINLSGDGAQHFFGQEATFAMAVEQPDECLAAKYARLLSFLKKDIEVGVITIVYYGTKCFLVHDTKINI